MQTGGPCKGKNKARHTIVGFMVHGEVLGWQAGRQASSKERQAGFSIKQMRMGLLGVKLLRIMWALGRKVR